MKLSADERRSIATRYRDGASATELAVSYRVSKSTVLRTLRAEGVEVRSTYVLTDEQKDAAVAMYAQGLSTVAIGRALGVTGYSIRDLLARRGVRRRNVAEAARASWRTGRKNSPVAV